MRRHEREVTDTNDIKAIIAKGTYITLGLMDKNEPYLVSLCYGYDSIHHTMYFHCAKEGRKIEILKANNHVAFQIIGNTSLKTGPVACNFSMYYSSIVGNGKIHFVEDNEEKKEAFILIMKQYTDAEKYDFTMPLDKIGMLKLEITEMKAKVHDENI